MNKDKIDIHVYFTQQELDQVHLKMKEMGVTCRSSYLRKMALDGYCIYLDLKQVEEMITLLRRCSNNLNQYAKKANGTGNIYATDIQDLKVRLDDIWKKEKEILESLAKII